MDPKLAFAAKLSATFLLICSLTSLASRVHTDVPSVPLDNSSVRQIESKLEFDLLVERRLEAVKDVVNQEVLDGLYKYLYEYEEADEQLTLSEFSLKQVMTKPVALVYPDTYIHRYDRFDDLRQSGGSDAKQELCIVQLTELAERAEQLDREQYKSSDINIIQLLDTFGKPPAGLLSGGDAFWPGMYYQCLKFTIRLKHSGGKKHLQATSARLSSDVKQTATRYCLTSLRHKDWSRDGREETIGIMKSGACLPKACDSLNYKNKFQLIMHLMETQLRPMDRGNFYISDLYCLPDEQSDLRQFWRSPASLLTFLALTGWVGLQVFATIWVRKQRSADDKIIELGSEHRLGLSKGSKVDTTAHLEDSTSQMRGQLAVETVKQPPAALGGSNETTLKLFRCLSITDNIAKLFDTSRTSSLIEVGASGESKDKIGVQGQVEKAMAGTPIVDLRFIEGIKVISMSYIIIGHALMCLSMAVNNGRELAGQISVAFFVANIIPALAVNGFFTITGLLTAYLLLKRNQSLQFMSSPTNWIAFIVYRYLRIMPMYLLVVIYLKTLAKFTGSGPLWDYGTTAMGPRKICEQESLLWTLLFGANFKPVLEQCIPAAWYLANDFQFFLVTPILLTILSKSPQMGKRILGLGMIASYLLSVYVFFNAPLEDLRPVANFMPHGFKTFTNHLSHVHTQPQYRISAYLFGLLVGVLLHEFEQQQLKYLCSRAKQESPGGGDNNASFTGVETESKLEQADWPESIRRYGFAISIICVSICATSPIIASKLSLSKLDARFMVAFLVPALHIIASLAVGIYILLASTGFGNPIVNRILSYSFWKPLTRLSLCVVLINIEVITYIIQTSTRSMHVGFVSQFGLDLLSIVLVYAVATVLCVLFEAPLRGALNLLVFNLMSKIAKKRKLD